MTTADQEIMASGLPPSAVTLREAFRLFALPDRVAEARRLNEERKRYPARIRSKSTYVYGPEVKPDNQRAHRVDQLELALRANGRAARKDLFDQLLDGRLVGYRRASAFEPWTCVQPDTWTDLKPDFHESTVKDRDGKIYAVRVDKAETAEQVPVVKVSDKKIGCHVAEPPQGGAGHYRLVEIAFEDGKVSISGTNASAETRNVVLGRNCGLFKALIDARLEDQEEGKHAVDYKYISAKDFAAKSQPNTPTRTVSRARRDLAKFYLEIFDQPVDPLQIIENKRGSGYRLAPNFRAIRSSVSP